MVSQLLLLTIHQIVLASIQVIVAMEATDILEIVLNASVLHLMKMMEVIDVTQEIEDLVRIIFIYPTPFKIKNDFL